jgi:hypothetical protein
MEIHQQRSAICKLKEKKNWKYILPGDTNRNWQKTKTTETPKCV